MTYKEQFEWCQHGATQTAKEINEPVVIIESEVLHDHDPDNKLNWIAERARYTLYPDKYNDYWKIVARVMPDGTFTKIGESK